MLTVMETSVFARRAEQLLTVEEHEDLILYLALHPESRDVIPGAGGVRKVRFAAKGRGKSGGVRAIYYFFDEQNPRYALFSRARTNNRTSLHNRRRPRRHLWPELRQWRESGGLGHEAEEHCKRANRIPA
jgi:hypothetical protein